MELNSNTDFFNYVDEWYSNVLEITEEDIELAGIMSETEDKEEKGRTYQVLLPTKKLVTDESTNLQMEVDVAEENNLQNIALLKLATEENTIVCLPTGAGKTYIAAELTKYYIPDAIERDKKIVFLANTVPLVHQQADYFRKRLCLSFGNVPESHIKEFTGDMNVDVWDKPQWDIEIGKAQIFVMTSEILRMALDHAFIPFSKINLLILDECHHAGKDHPMAKIMENYEKIKRETPDYELPRVLGLTATIIRGNSKVGEIPTEVRDMEKRLCCKALTYHDYEEVLRHSTSAEVQLVRYKKSMEFPEVEEIMTIVEAGINFIDHYKNVVQDSRKQNVDEVDHPTLLHPNQMYNKKKKPLEEFTKPLKDVKKVCEELGPYAARLAASLKRAYLQVKDGEDELRDLLRLGADTALSRVIACVDLMMTNQIKSHQVQTFVTDKVKLLYRIFLDWKELKGKEELCAIVFCTERLTAQILTWIFLDAKKHWGDKFQFVKPAFVVGSSRTNNDLEEQRITIKKQEDVIQKFHRKEINLVFATNVLEEGLNVPSCSLIIRFDPFNKYPSFVQSMGRARKKDALFYVLASEEDASKTQGKINEYTDYNNKLATHLKDEARHLDIDDDSSTVSTDSNEIIPLAIDPTDPDSPKITLTDAVSLVHRYCQNLACDKLVVLEPYSWWTAITTGEDAGKFKAYIQLPSNALVREVTDGIARDSKNDAKRAAYLEVCKKLYAKGAFNAQLLPLRRTIPPKVTIFIDTVEDEDYDGDKKVGTQKRTQWYLKKIPDIVEKSRVTAGITLNVCWISMRMIKPTMDSTEHIQLFQFENKRHAFAILTQQNLSVIPPVYLESHYAYFESTYVNVKIKRGSTFTKEEIQKIKTFQNFIFSKNLKIKHSIMKNADAEPFLVVALIKDDNGDWDINWDVIEKLQNLNDEDYRKKVEESERLKMSPSAEDYEDAVVVSWHRQQDTELLIHCVCRVRPDLTHTSPIEESDPNSPTFEHYYSEKYELNILCPHQPYLMCTPLGSQLNFLSKKKDLLKMDKEDRKAHRYNSSVIVLVPEFCRIYPMSASLLAQARFLPSILQRTYRLMLSTEIQRSIAHHCNWNAALNWKGEQGVVNTKCCKGFHPYQQECPSLEKIPQEESEAVNVRNETMQKLSHANFGLLASIDDLSELNQPSSSSSNVCASKRKLKREEWKSRDHEDNMHLDYIHPDAITTKEISDHRKWKVKLRDDLTMNSDSARLKKSSDVERQYPLINLEDINFPSLDVKTDFSKNPGPSPVIIMESITVSNANDCLSLENLEVIGDSFLKYAVSTLLFCEYPKEDEGVMTQIRNKLVSNRHLYTHGNKKKLGEIISGGIFLPDNTFLPPGVTVPKVASSVAAQCDINFDVFTQSWDEIEQMSEAQLTEWIETTRSNVPIKAPPHTTYTHSRLGDKNISDSVEALIGAYYMHGGVDAAFKVMDWLNLRFPNPEGIALKYGRCSSPISNRRAELFTNPNVKPEKFLSFIDELEQLICYKFKDRWLLVEAFSHPGYLKNDVTDCYQRLEFLGDAILDFLVTNHIYTNRLAKTPGELTDLRSALVNNVTFGSLVVRYGFHKYLLSVSKQLQDVIDTFVAYQEENGHAVTGHFKLLNDYECSLATEIEVPKVLGDIFESLAGAVFLDCNMSLDTTWKVFFRLMKNEIDEFSENTPKSPVRELNERFPGLKFRPIYLNNEELITPQGWTVVGVKLQDTMYYGCGTNAKQARQAAAKYALKCLSGN